MRNRTGKSKINYVNYLKGVFKFTLIHLIKLSLYLYNTVFMTESALKQKLDEINTEMPTPPGTRKYHIQGTKKANPTLSENPKEPQRKDESSSFPGNIPFLL